MEKLESTFNKSVKTMLKLPFATTDTFITNIEKSGKTALRDLLRIVRNDVRTCTGSNLRRIMLLTGRTSTCDLSGSDFEYHKVPESEAWRIDFIKELIEIQEEGLKVDGMQQAEFGEIID